MARRKTISDLAEAAGVSVSTIDRILSGRGPVKRLTVEHVLETAERIGFHATGAIRGKLTEDAPERTLGFLLNARERNLYAQLGEGLSRATAASSLMRGRAVLRYLESIDPEEAAVALRALGREVHAIAAVLVDHPLVNLAVSDLTRAGVPVFSLMSDISAPQRTGFLGASDWQLGRTAGWFMQRLRPEGGRVGMLVGSGRYLCQQAHEMSFRQYLADSGAPHEVLPSRHTMEEDKRAYQLTLELLAAEPKLAGLMVAGGGLDGVIAAIRKRDRRDVVVIGTELTDAIRPALLDGTVDVVLSHPALGLVDRTVSAMVDALEHPGGPPIQHIVPFEIAISENV
ncbi:substrate-binding domain-containing protein [Frigidibacter sp. MR17.24]|uniref:substrate-binding domain-containing protein n=1 Tax=Frigidibacter sp. MR17.24 TaxID=3127345 RepID=UPI00301315D0